MDTVSLNYLTRGKRVIPLVMHYAHLCITDVKLPNLLLTNHGKHPIMPIALEVAGFAKEARVVTYTPPIEQLHATIRQMHPQLRDKLAHDREGLMLWVGDVQVDHARLSDTEVIPPGHCAILLLSYQLAVHHAGSAPLTRLEISLTIDADGTRETLVFPVPLSHAPSDIPYHFPIHGLVRVGNLPGNYAFHRQAHAQEFAVDIVGICPHAAPGFVTHTGETLSDYPIYRRPVLAVADGVVVAAGDAYPEDETVPPLGWSPEISAARIEALRTKIGYGNAVAGNYLVIRHAPGECAFYAHLSHRTQRVQVGDTVAAGQEIALVGSTGNSSEPHLHFQLMDGPDPLTANGLPIMFTDVPASLMNQCFTSANSLAVADALMLSLATP